MALPLKELLEQVTFNADRPEDLDAQAILDTMAKFEVVRIRGIVKPDEIVRAREKIRQNFDWRRDQKSLGEDPKDLHGNYQKLSIGGAQGYGVYRPRCIRTMYNPLWAEDIYGLRESFRRLARVRNVVYGFPIDFAVDRVDDGMWTASRIHHYPRGGGFLIEHKDTVVPRMQRDKGYPAYYQPILVLSKKGKGLDFEEGGGFMVYDDQRYYYESECEYGDIVVYDGRTIHGVGDIDPHLAFRQDSIEGRLVGFATLYKEMSKGEKLFDESERDALTKDGAERALDRK